MEYKKSLQKEISNTVRLFFEGKHAAKYILLSIVTMTEHGFGYWVKTSKRTRDAFNGSLCLKMQILLYMVVRNAAYS